MMRLFKFGLFALLFAAMAHPALAQAISVPDIFSGAGDDRSNSLFNLIFGSLFPGANANNRTLISLLMLSFNILFLSVGAIFTLYNIFQGVLDSAHEGVVLGQKSTIWAPIRILTAFALLIPLGNGYNGAQHAVSYVVRAGTAAGTFFWNQTADLIIADEVPIVGSDYVANDAKFLQQLWRIEICRAAYNDQVGLGGELEQVNAGAWESLGITDASNLVDGYAPEILRYSTPQVTAACGSITLPPATAALKRISPSTNMAQVNAQFKTVIDAIRGDIATSATNIVNKLGQRQPLVTGDIADLGAMMRQLRQAHSAIVNPIVNPNTLSQLVRTDSGTPIETQIRAVGSESGAALSAPTAVSGDLKTGGWMMAGSYYMLISKIAGDATAVSSMYPTITPGTLISTSQNDGLQNTLATQLNAGRWFGGGDRDAAKILANIGLTYNAAVNAWNEKAAQSGIREFITERAYAGDDASSPENFMPPPTKLLGGVALLNPTKIEVDPMVGLMGFSNTLLFYSVSIILGLSVVAAVPLVGNGVATFASMLGPIISIGAMIAVGIGYVLPYMPAVIWFFAVLAFMLLVIEAIFAAPLWMIATLSMDGNGIASNISRRGWSLLLMIFLMPMLMVFGFLIGMVMFRIGAFLLNGMLFAALSSQMVADSNAFGAITSYIVIVVVTLFTAIIYLVLIDWCFRMVNTLPSGIFKWIDGMGEDLGASQSTKAMAAAGALTYQGGGAIGGAPSGAKQISDGKRKEIEDRRKEKV